ncbi:MAG: site-specific integrase [Bacteroidales bacterium]|nr:site-specific integrase [Bacteroidales bacterium]
MAFYLKTPNSTYSIVWYKSGGIRTSTGISIPTKYWDKEKHQVTRLHPNYKEINRRLKEFVPAPTSKKEEILPFYLLWATKGTATKTMPRRGDYYSYNVFKEFAPEGTTFDDIDYSFYNNFVLFLQDRGLSVNSIGTHIRNLKAVMNEAYKQGLHNNLAYKNFKKTSEEIDSVYLTEEELDAVRNLNLCGQSEKVRDLFLIGCNTAMRFSDYSRLTKDWIIDDEIHFISTKTSQRQVIPLAQEVKDILAKYNGKAPAVNQQAFNKIIKDVCRRAGLVTSIQVEKTLGRDKVVDMKEKWELVSSHTARRTAATLLIKKGAPIAWVMSLTGHKTESAFWKYVKLSREDYAKLLKSFVK